MSFGRSLFSTGNLYFAKPLLEGGFIHMALTNVCWHEHRTHLGGNTRREIEPFFEGLEASTGTVDLFEDVESAVLNIQNADAVSWCRDCSHVLLTWIVGDAPLDMSFSNTDAEEFLKKKFGD